MTVSLSVDRDNITHIYFGNIIICILKKEESTIKDAGMNMCCYIFLIMTLYVKILKGASYKVLYSSLCRVAQQNIGL